VKLKKNVKNCEWLLVPLNPQTSKNRKTDDNSTKRQLDDDIDNWMTAVKKSENTLIRNNLGKLERKEH